MKYQIEIEEVITYSHTVDFESDLSRDEVDELLDEISAEPKETNTGAEYVEWLKADKNIKNVDFMPDYIGDREIEIPFLDELSE